MPSTKYSPDEYESVKAKMEIIQRYNDGIVLMDNVRSFKEHYPHISWYGRCNAARSHFVLQTIKNFEAKKQIKPAKKDIGEKKKADVIAAYLSGKSIAECTDVLKTRYGRFGAKPRNTNTQFVRRCITKYQKYLVELK